MSDDKDKKKPKKNPWGDAPKKSSGPSKTPPRSSNYGGNDDIPNLEEMLKKAKGDFGGMVPGNIGGGGIGIIAGLVLLVLTFTLCAYIVKPGEQAVIQRLGAWERTKVNEGLSFKLPWPIETVAKVNVNQVRKMTIGYSDVYGRGGVGKRDIPAESLMLTSDRNIVDVDLEIQWDIKSAEQYLFEIKGQEQTIKQVAESAIREQIGKTDMFKIITTDRDIVANQARQILQDNLDEYNSGVNIKEVLIQTAEVHPDVQSAFQDVQSAKQDAEDKQNVARAYREDIIPKARGQAIQLTQNAEAYKQSTVARATGDASRFDAVYQAYKTGEDVTKKRIYLETMEDVLQNAQKIIIDDNGGKNGVVPYLPLNELKKNQ